MTRRPGDENETGEGGRVKVQRVMTGVDAGSDAGGSKEDGDEGGLRWLK